MNNKKLYRSRTDMMLAGVCGGLADFFGLDVSLIRIFFVLMAILGGHGLLLYLILWVIVPQDPNPAVVIDPSQRF